MSGAARPGAARPQGARDVKGARRYRQIMTGTAAHTAAQPIIIGVDVRGGGGSAYFVVAVTDSPQAQRRPENLDCFL